MNRPNYCPVNTSTQVAGQFPSQAYLFVSGAGQQVSGDHLFKSSAMNVGLHSDIGMHVMYVCMYVCMSVSICIYIICMCNIYIFMYVCMYIYMRICIYVYACIYVCIYVCKSVCIHMVACARHAGWIVRLYFSIVITKANSKCLYRAPLLKWTQEIFRIYIH